MDRVDPKTENLIRGKSLQIAMLFTGGLVLLGFSALLGWGALLSVPLALYALSKAWQKLRALDRAYPYGYYIPPHP